MFTPFDDRALRRLGIALVRRENPASQSEAERLIQQKMGAYLGPTAASKLMTAQMAKQALTRKGA